MGKTKTVEEDKPEYPEILYVQNCGDGFTARPWLDTLSETFGPVRVAEYKLVRVGKIKTKSRFIPE